MPTRIVAVLLCGLAALQSGFAKDKQQPVLPSYILRARTVAVLVDPYAGVDVTEPQANRTAQKDVEAALLNWGRYRVVIDSATADLLIVVRRGDGKAVKQTIPDPGQNRRPGILSTTDTGILIGAQRGRQPNAPGQTDSPNIGRPTPQLEAGATEDSFAVFQGQPDGQRENALDSPPGWRYVAKDGLRSHGVPAVDVFRKAVADAEKAAGKP